jgi:hypothetical protein
MRWVFLVVFLAFTLASATDLKASGVNATEVAICMISKSPYPGSFDRWDYADYCSGSLWWDLTDTKRMEIQYKIDELTKYSSPDTFTDESCKCFPPDYDDDDDLSEGTC